jgi:hypothetical protein
MLSAHCKPPTNVVNKTFFTALSSVFIDLHPEADIEFAIPSLEWDAEYFSKYDLIFIGLVPPTSLSANRVYGTLKCLDTLFDSPNVRLVLDSPQLWQYLPGFSAISKDPTYLITEFYSKRPDYRKADSYKNLISFKSVSEKFLTKQWPMTLYPRLPWHDSERLSKYLPNASNSIQLNLDSHFLVEPKASMSASKAGWAVDNHGSKWAKKLRHTVSHVFNEVKLSKKFNDSDALDMISDSIGVVVPPIDRGVGTWWNYRYIQGLIAGVPVATDWTESANIGPAWSVLPYQIEDMSAESRFALARAQYESYVESIPSKPALKEFFKVVLVSKGE